MTKQNEQTVVLEAQIISWDSYFMHLALESASRSKDPNTKVGACIVKDKRVLSLGYNGAPRDFPDHLVPLTNSDILQDSKNSYMVHAELNAILNFRGSLSELKGSTIYVTTSPCHECAKAIAQAGISEVVYLNEYHLIETWNMSKVIFDWCGVKYRKLEE